MYRCILAPVDGGSFGEWSLPIAATIAARVGASLRIAHVYVPMLAPAGMETVALAGPWNGILKQQVNAYLSGLAARVSASFGIQVNYEVMDGVLPEALREYAERCRADLVVMSTHGHSGIRRVWHHCVAEQLGECLEAPVLLVRPDSEDGTPDLSRHWKLRHVLVAAAPGDSAALLVENAAEIARGSKARLSVLRVLRPQSVFSGRTLEGQSPDTGGEVSARRELDAVASRYRGLGWEVTCGVRTGRDAAEQIIAYSDEQTALGRPFDLIVMARRPQRGITQVLAPPVEDEVVGCSVVPVLLVHARPGLRPDVGEQVALPMA